MEIIMFLKPKAIRVYQSTRVGTIDTTGTVLVLEIQMNIQAPKCIEEESMNTLMAFGLRKIIISIDLRSDFLRSFLPILLIPR